MTLRATRQYADVLGPGDGALRVTRQYVEALVPGLLLVEVTDNLGLTDSNISLGPRYETVVDSLGIGDSNDWQGPRYLEMRHNLNVTDSNWSHLGVVNVWVSDTLAFTEKRGRAISVSVTDTITFTTVGIKTNAITQPLTFTETIQAAKSKDVKSTLSVSQTYSVKGTFNRSVTDELKLVHSGAYQASGGPCLSKQFKPQLGFTSDESVSIPSGVTPTLSAGTLTLTFPYVDPTTTLVLRNPQFANKDSLNFNRINRTTRGGSLVVYADSHWPKTQRLNLEIRALRALQAAATAEFFDLSLGLEVGLLDHEGRQWRGIITNPESPIVNPERGDYSVSFEFEGVPC